MLLYLFIYFVNCNVTAQMKILSINNPLITSFLIFQSKFLSRLIQIIINKQFLNHLILIPFTV